MLVYGPSDSLKWSVLVSQLIYEDLRLPATGFSLNLPVNEKGYEVR